MVASARRCQAERLSSPPCDTDCGCTTKPAPVGTATYLVLHPRDPNAEPAALALEDTYALVVDGTAWIGKTTVYERKDGTQTHVVTVRGIRPEPAP